jgi:hypothetical protein
MGKRNTNPALIEPAMCDELILSAKRRRLPSPKNSAALALLSLMNAESDFARSPDESEESRKAAAYRKLESFNKKKRGLSICSSVTDDEDEVVSESISSRTTGGFSFEAQDHSLTKAALAGPSILQMPQGSSLFKALPQGRPLPPPPGLPKTILCKSGSFATKAS